RGRVIRLRGGHRPASIPRHRRATRARRLLRAGGGRSRLTASGSLDREGGEDLGQGQGEFRATTDRVMTEEDERVDPIGQERLRAGGPRRALATAVVRSTH